MDIQHEKRMQIRRFALIGCAYGNVPALKACLDHARQQGCEALYFLGDAIGCCGHSNEVIDLIETSFDGWLSGNLEQQAVREATGCGCGFTSGRDSKISGTAFRYAREELDDSHRNRLAKWPDLIRLETERQAFLLCHGSPARKNEFLYRSELSGKPWRSWCADHDVQGLFCAHTGFPWYHRTGSFVLGNCGAAGKPDHDGDPAVHYAIVHLETNPPEVTIPRVTYDVEEWTRELADDGVDEIYRAPLKTGRWTYGLSPVPEPELQERNAKTGR